MNKTLFFQIDAYKATRFLVCRVHSKTAVKEYNLFEGSSYIFPLLAKVFLDICNSLYSVKSMVPASKERCVT